MPAKSVKQKRLMGITLAIKRGELPESYSSEAAKVVRTMSEKALKHFAKSKEKGLPKRKKKRR